MRTHYLLVQLVGILSALAFAAGLARADVVYENYSPANGHASTFERVLNDFPSQWTQIGAPFTVPPCYDYVLNDIEITGYEPTPSGPTVHERIKVYVYEGPNSVGPLNSSWKSLGNVTFNPLPKIAPGVVNADFGNALGKTLKAGTQYWIIMEVSGNPGVYLTDARWMHNNAGQTGTILRVDINSGINNWIATPNSILPVFRVLGTIKSLPPCFPCAAGTTIGPDAWMRDNLVDDGNEVNHQPGDLWISPDIWVRNARAALLPTFPGRRFKSEHDNENPEYATHPDNTPWVYTKVCNRGDSPVSGTVELYWANGSTGLMWPDDWELIPPDPTPPSELPSTTITNLLPGDVWVVDRQWQTIHPPTESVNGHFCLLARFVPDAGDPINGEQINVNIWGNVQRSNNIAWRNVTVVNTDPSNISPGPGGGCEEFFFRNISGTDTGINLLCNALSTEFLDTFLDHGQVFLHLPVPVLQAWLNSGGGSGCGGLPCITSGLMVLDDSTVEILDTVAQLLNIPMEAGEEHIACVEFDLSQNQFFPDERRFEFRVAQSVVAAPDPDGGVHYDIRVPSTCYATGDVNGDGIALSPQDAVLLDQVLRGQAPVPTTISAGDLNGDCVIDSNDASMYSCYFTFGISCLPAYPIPTCCEPPVVRTCDCPCAGDPTCDGISADILDVLTVVNVAFRGSAVLTDIQCPSERTDFDASGSTDVVDVVKCINVAFRGQSLSANYVDPCS